MQLPYCLQNIIGVSPLCNESGVQNPRTLLPEPPKSGLYITDLEGISINMSAKIVNGEDMTGINLMKKKINFATGLVLNDFSRYLNPYFRVNKALDLVIAGRFSQDYLPLTALNRGLHITRLDRSLYSLRIVKLIILANTTILNKQIFVIDGDNIYTYYVDLVANQPAEVLIDRKLQFDNAYILMDNSDIAVNDGTFDYNIGGQLGCGCRSVYNRSSPYQNSFHITGWNGLMDEQRNFGITAQIEIGCDLEAFYCAVSKHLYYLFLYRSGLELAKEWLHSERINEYTTISRAQAGLLIEEWKVEYDRLYQQAIQEVKEVVKQMDCGCVECRGTGYGYQI